MTHINNNNNNNDNDISVDNELANGTIEETIFSSFIGGRYSI